MDDSLGPVVRCETHHRVGHLAEECSGQTVVEAAYTWSVSRAMALSRAKHARRVDDDQEGQLVRDGRGTEEGKTRHPGLHTIIADGLFDTVQHPLIARGLQPDLGQVEGVGTRPRNGRCDTCPVSGHKTGWGSRRVSPPSQKGYGFFPPAGLEGGTTSRPGWGRGMALWSIADMALPSLWGIGREK